MDIQNINIVTMVNNNSKPRFLIYLFYEVKPYIPRKFQLILRRLIAYYKLKRYKNIWPIDKKTAKLPYNWKGWPEGKRCAFVLMHDVDSQRGHDNCRQLMDIDEKYGFRSTFNFVAEKYNISNSLIKEIKDRGFGIGVHGIKHDGKLFINKKIFLKRSKKINSYLSQWETKGFSSPAMHRNLEWMLELKIDYSTSTFDTDPFEPQQGPADTIFPLWISNGNADQGFVEMPYTLPQDHLLYIILKRNNIKIWTDKTDWLFENNAMILLNSHPDYMEFHGALSKKERYPVRYYEDYLKYINTKYRNLIWNCLPSELSKYFKYNYVMELMK